MILLWYFGICNSLKVPKNSKDLHVHSWSLSLDEQTLKISRRYLDWCLRNRQLTENLLQRMAQDWSLLGKIAKSDQSWAICCNNFSVNQPLLKYESRYLLEIFSICSSHVCANLTKKFWPKLKQPACYGPFWPKL